MTRVRSSSPPRTPNSVPDDRKMPDVSPHPLTLPAQSGALPEHVRELLDWLIDEELERWRREEQ